MLVLTRKKDEGILIGDDILIVINRTQEGRVRIGINAPGGIEIARVEILDDAKQEELQEICSTLVTSIDGASKPEPAQAIA